MGFAFSFWPICANDPSAQRGNMQICWLDLDAVLDECKCADNMYKFIHVDVIAFRSQRHKSNIAFALLKAIIFSNCTFTRTDHALKCGCSNISICFSFLSSFCLKINMLGIKCTHTHKLKFTSEHARNRSQCSAH